MTDGAQGRAQDGVGLRWVVAGALLVLVLAYVWKGSAGVRYPYHVVRASFAYANSWALGEGGPSLRRVFQALEALALLWFAVVAWIGVSRAREASSGAKVMLAGLAVASLPLVPFLWALTSAYGILTPEMAALLVRTA